MPHPANIYEARVVRICEVVNDEGVIDDFEFIGCEIRGPAVLFLDGSTLNNNSLPGPADALLWEIPHDRRIVYGAVHVKNTRFERCNFTNVGLAGPPEFIRTIRRDLGGG